MKVSYVRQGYSLYGAVEVGTGESCFLEGTRMNTQGFQEFINLLSNKYPDDFHILQLDNASFHTSTKLTLPDNMMLLYQPPYSPETNPIEQVWSWIKSRLAGELFKTVDQLKETVNQTIEEAGLSIFKSIVHRDFILDALRQARIQP